MKIREEVKMNETVILIKTMMLMLNFGVLLALIMNGDTYNMPYGLTILLEFILVGNIICNLFNIWYQAKYGKI
jgi:hypothetical protein